MHPAVLSNLIEQKVISCGVMRLPFSSQRWSRLYCLRVRKEKSMSLSSAMMRGEVRYASRGVR